MINLTKEQIVESLIRLKEYSHWMYYSDAAINKLKLSKTIHKNHTFNIFPLKEGLITATLETGSVGIYGVKIITGEIKHGIDNIDIQTKLLNKDKLSKEDIEYFEEIGIFVCSYFQRLVAFTFFCRMQYETINGIANDLMQCNNLENDIDKTS